MSTILYVLKESEEYYRNYDNKNRLYDDLRIKHEYAMPVENPQKPGELLPKEPFITEEEFNKLTNEELYITYNVSVAVEVNAPEFPHRVHINRFEYIENPDTTISVKYITTPLTEAEIQKEYNWELARRKERIKEHCEWMTSSYLELTMPDGKRTFKFSLSTDAMTQLTIKHEIAKNDAENFSVVWNDDGKWIKLSSTDIKFVFSSINKFVQDQYDRFCALDLMLDHSTIDTIYDIDVYTELPKPMTLNL